MWYTIIGAAYVAALGCTLAVWVYHSEKSGKLLDPACPHDNKSPVAWTQDGWVEVCADCGEWLYLGDDYALGAPADVGDYRRK